jgi:D-aminopeptidase
MRITVGDIETGPLDAITDVPGVRVGHVTLVEGDAVRTGVTAIVPHGGNVFRKKVPAAIEVANGFGKLVGYTQVRELGELETAILLTNTLAVWDAASALVDHTLALSGNEDVRSVNPVVGETNDGWLNDIRSRPLRREHFVRALEQASGGPVQQGAVGAGTGTVALGWKGGIGTASRKVGPHVVGVLVQTNFGGTLTLPGGETFAPSLAEDGSCMIVIATDAPLHARQLGRLARRSFAGMARAGASFSHGSGDYAIAFATADGSLPDDALTPYFEAVADATQEAIYNSLLHAETMRGHAGHVAKAWRRAAPRKR